jgi:dCMP deaminase
MTNPPLIVVPSWDDYFMTLVYHVASRSKDQRTHMGAIIVGPDNILISTGYNSFPRHINDDNPERQKKGEKQFWMLHAEENAILNSERASLKGCVLYVNAIPCIERCAQPIVQKGIKEVVVDSKWPTNTLEWAERNRRTLEMFLEAGVHLRYLDTHYVPIAGFNDGVAFPLI